MNTPLRKTLRRSILAVVVGSFSIAAAMGVFVLVLGGEFGETEGRILLTTLIIGCTSLVVLACLTTLDTRFQPVGLLGVASALVTVGLGLVLIWGDWTNGPEDWLLKSFGVGCTVSLTLAQIALLLAVSRHRPDLRWLVSITLVAATVLAIWVCLLIVETVDGGDTTARFLGVIAIIDALGTVLTIALSVFTQRAAAGRVVREVYLPEDVADQAAAQAATLGISVEDLVVNAVRRELAQAAVERPERPGRPDHIVG